MKRKEPKPLVCACGANNWEYYGKDIKNHSTKFNVVCLWCGAEGMIQFVHTQPNEVIGK